MKKSLGCLAVIGAVLLAVGWCAFEMFSSAVLNSNASMTYGSSRFLGLACISYAEDHDGEIPTGDSSTEVLQLLLDEGYVDEEFIQELYVSMPGKTPYPGSGPIKPEHVCVDIITPLNLDSPEALPLVMTTGWEVKFQPGARLKILDKKQARALDGVVVFRIGGGGEWIRMEQVESEPFIPEAIVMDQEYRQLRP